MEPVDIRAVIKNVKHKLDKIGLSYVHFELEPIGYNFAVRFYAKDNDYVNTFRFKPYEPTIQADTPEELEYELIDKAFRYLRLQSFDTSEAKQYEFVKWEMEL